MAGTSVEAVDAVDWSRFRTGVPEHHPVKEVPRALRRLVRRGPAATEEDCHPLYSCLFAPGGGLPSAAAAALPFLTALAADPANGARVTLVELLGALNGAAREAGEQGTLGAWREGWRRQGDKITALLADPEPSVRRAALLLADDDALLQRWHAETEPAVRLPLLLALGTRATTADAPETGSPGGRHRFADAVEAVLSRVLRDDEPVMKVAAVIARASLDRDAPLRHADLLLDVLADPAVRPRFERIWWLPDVEIPFTRDDVAAWVSGLLDHDPPAALSFVTRLAEAAERTADDGLRRVVLDEAWRHLVLRRSAAPTVLPLAARLLDSADDCVRLKAAHLLAMLAPDSGPYADRLAALLDDPGTDEISWIEGTVGDFARWALVRLGDPRGLPGLVESLWAPYREQFGRSWVAGDPRRPEMHEVLAPLREHADVLLPALLEEVRQDHERHGDHGEIMATLLHVAEAWGPDALPVLPVVLPLLKDTRYSLRVVDVLLAMGPGAASTASAVRDAVVLDHPANHHRTAWAAWRIAGGDDGTALRLLGEAVHDEQASPYGPVLLLSDFGPAAAAHAGRVREVMENAAYGRVTAAVALWAITGDPGPTLAVLEEVVVRFTGDDDRYGDLAEALRGFLRIGTVTPAARRALRLVGARDARLSNHRDYRAVLDDQELRSAIAAVLALP
ncbi:hypothetical protein JK359_38000 [Streptomyces actinomycinicus]|uniref:HEAT repeat domain-containing protein n=1 Tax=Streptomyces actinomycinicus TaxID=1695166 RepID=A0A937ESI0_9ACTN|nr:hypothetical protein [Streptomyces actinomycinicus]MBL1087660.1 hypothetical protein [Streptomyces actinomycinicus]